MQAMDCAIALKSPITGALNGFRVILNEQRQVMNFETSPLCAAFRILATEEATFSLPARWNLMTFEALQETVNICNDSCFMTPLPAKGTAEWSAFCQRVMAEIYTCAIPNPHVLNKAKAASNDLGVLLKSRTVASTWGVSWTGKCFSFYLSLVDRTARDSFLEARYGAGVARDSGSAEDDSMADLNALATAAEACSPLPLPERTPSPRQPTVSYYRSKALWIRPPRDEGVATSLYGVALAVGSTFPTSEQAEALVARICFELSRGYSRRMPRARHYRFFCTGRVVEPALLEYAQAHRHPDSPAAVDCCPFYVVLSPAQAKDGPAVFDLEKTNWEQALVVRSSVLVHWCALTLTRAIKNKVERRRRCAGGAAVAGQLL